MKEKLIPYNRRLKENSRLLRYNGTEAEKKLWHYIRRKQLLGIQFYRQKPIENHIVDFCAHRPKVIIELDGSQHYQPKNRYQDKQRDSCLKKLGFTILRYDNRDVMRNIHAVLQDIQTRISLLL